MKKRIILFISCMLLAVVSMYAQKTFSGKVVGVDGLGLPGVSVVERANTTNGVYTDIDGKWTLTVPNGDTMLEFTSVGFKTVVIPAKNSTYLKMENDAQLLDAVEVVATGYGLIEKAGYTGSAAVVNNDDLVRSSSGSLGMALQGKIAGVQVMGNDIKIRGYGGLDGATDSPLFVVDGVVGAPQPSFEDVETVTVLKDAAATAMYGSQGANGVIVMTLKKGREGKTKFNFKYSRDIEQRNKPKWERLNAAQYYQYYFNLARDKYYHFYNDETKFSLAFQDMLLKGCNPFNIDVPTNLDGTLKKEAKLLYDTNWEDAVYKKTKQSDRVYFSISGGTDNTNYNIATTFENDGTFDKAEYDSKTIANDVNFGTKLGKRIRFDLRTRISYSQNRSGTTSYPYWYAPVSPIYKMKRVANGDGTFRVEKVEPEEFNWTGHPNGNLKNDANAVGQIALNTDSNEGTGLALYIVPKITIDFSDKLHFHSLVTGIYNTSLYENFSNPKHGTGTDEKGTSIKRTSFVRAISMQNLFTYHNTFFEKHKIDVTAGTEYFYDISKGFSANRTGFTLGTVSSEFNFGTKNGTPESNTEEGARISYISRLGYNYAGKYYLSGSFRRDGSSRFGPSTRWGNFWSVGASWRISEEKFLKDIEWVNDLKLRFSHGVTGNAYIPKYSFGDYYTVQASNGKIGLNHQGLPNSLLAWERAENTSFALDFELLNNRLSGTFEWYKRGSDGLLYQYPIPSTSGFSTILMNVAEMENKGVEIALNGVIIKNDNLQWNMGLTFSHNKNEILSLPNHTPNYTGWTKKVWKEGNSRYQYRLKEWAGVNPENGEAQWYKDEKQADGTIKKVVTNDYQKATLYENVGESAPKNFWGYSNYVTYKGFDLSVDLIGAWGHKIYDGGYQSVMHDGNNGFSSSLATDALDYWTPENKNSKNPKAIYEAQNYSNDDSTRWLVDGAFVKIKNIAIGYTLPTHLVRKVSLSSLRFFVFVDNVQSFSDYKSGDPEVGYDGIGDSGIYGGRSFRLGFDVKF
ncbi:MAG: SusC/RagA family TonB-linked outer membrane protein [Flavobacteriaceae bacterium]|nr:SusC/RagA family TonB-linked outer membrane protein [Flavobacteriaceae bacterium]